MSLILDALRKLDRDKQPRDPGVVVVGHVPWGGRDPGRRLSLTVGATVVLALVLAGLWMLRPGSPSASPGSGEAPAVVAETALPRVTAPSAARAPVPSPGGDADAMAATPPPATTDAPPPPRGIELPAPGNLPAAPAVSPTVGGDAGPGGAAAEPMPAVPVAAPVAPPAGRDRSLRLTAISERDGRPVALLNDHLVREGDSFDGILVLRIGATEVEVEVDGRKRVVGF